MKLKVIVQKDNNKDDSAKVLMHEKTFKERRAIYKCMNQINNRRIRKTSRGYQEPMNQFDHFGVRN